jgi:hypothetical protein
MKPDSKYPEKGWFGGHREVFSYSKKGSMPFLHKDLDRVVALRGEGDFLSAHRSDKTVVISPLEFDGLHRVGRGPSYMVHPLNRGAVARSPHADPFSNLEPIIVCCGVPRNANCNDLLAGFIEDV